MSPHQRSDMRPQLLLVLFTFGIIHIRAENAAACARFIDSVGINAHWDYPDTPYGANLSVITDILLKSGIRHMRCGPDTGGGKPYIEGILRTLFQGGMRCTMVMEPIELGTIDFYANFTKTMNSLGSTAYIVSWEGPNEPDLFWVRENRTYQGQPYPQGVYNWQRDIYQYAKADQQLKAITIAGPSSGVTYDPGAGNFNPLCKFDMDSIVDWGNFHPYPGGNPFSYPFPYIGIDKYYWQSDFPSINLDEYPQAFKWGAIPYNASVTKMMATETGYSTNYAGGGIPISSHTKYIPRLFLEYFRLGVQRTLLYEFVDEFVDPTNTDRESNFGLVFHNCTAKPGLTALSSLLNLLDDSPDRSQPIVDPTFVPGSLNFNVSVTPVGNFTRTYFVHHLLLQKKNGDFYLPLWHEITDDNSVQTPQLIVSSPPMPVNITLSGNAKNPDTVTIYTYNSANELVGTPYTAYDPVKNPIILTDATDTVTVIVCSFASSTSSSSDFYRENPTSGTHASLPTAKAKIALV